jgi:hypothetical protein
MTELNSLQFSQNQLAELFKDSLVISDKTEKKAKSTVYNSQKDILEAPEIPYKGKNKKGMLWVIQEPGHVYLSDDDFMFLSQILTACNMNMNDIALTNLAQHNFSIQQIVTSLNPNVVLLCGVNTGQLGFQLEDYKIISQQNHQYFLADTLSEIRNDKVKKSKLWLALKTLYSL